MMENTGNNAKRLWNRILWVPTLITFAACASIAAFSVSTVRAADFCAAFEQGCRACSLRAHVSVSVGIAVTVGWQKSFDELYREADAALYRVKAEGKNDYHIYNDGVA